MFMKRIRMTVSAFLAAVFAACALVMPVSADIGEALLAGESVPLLVVITSFDPNGNGIAEAVEKRSKIRSINARLGDEIRRQALSDYDGLHLDSFAYCVNGKIKDPSVRNLHVMAAGE